VLCAAVDMDTSDRRPLEFLGKVRKVSPELADQVDQRLKGFAERYPENAASNYYYAYSLWQRGGGEEGKGLDEIERLLRKAVMRAPEWYEPHYLLGTVYDSEQRYQDALRELQRVVKIEPGYSPAHSRLAVLYSRTGDKAKAMQEASIAKKLKDAQRESEMVEEIEK
jgi:tetratricopeptide (TPR) repeat protein